ncbi:hypothetical protein [Mycobacteroides abscessus]|nr:hypothetical protein [Mycobacteroides abscessus]CPR73336.1 Uncharacterised protein [Mycobacteroides abscessus]CPU86203.1 Uncharacterised protein [Mycobacteroides abscessus]
MFDRNAPLDVEAAPEVEEYTGRHRAQPEQGSAESPETDERVCIGW